MKYQRNVIWNSRNYYYIVVVLKLLKSTFFWPQLSSISSFCYFRQFFEPDTDGEPVWDNLPSENEIKTRQNVLSELISERKKIIASEPTGIFWRLVSFQISFSKCDCMNKSDFPLLWNGTNKLYNHDIDTLTCLLFLLLP